MFLLSKCLFLICVSDRRIDSLWWFMIYLLFDWETWLISGTVCSGILVWSDFHHWSNVNSWFLFLRSLVVPLFLFSSLSISMSVSLSNTVSNNYCVMCVCLYDVNHIVMCAHISNEVYFFFPVLSHWMWIQNAGLAIIWRTVCIMCLRSTNCTFYSPRKKTHTNRNKKKKNMKLLKK